METGNKQKPLSLYLGIAALLLLITFYIRVQYETDRSYERLAYVLFGILYMMRFSMKPSRKVKDYAKVIAISTWCFVSVIAVVKFKYSFFIAYVCELSGLVWFATEIIDLIKGRVRQTNWILVLGALILSCEIYSRIFRLPGASIYHLFAMLVLSIGFFREAYVQRKSSQA